jgi:hypothetical protein
VPWRPEIKHHDGDDDRDDAIAERLDTAGTRKCWLETHTDATLMTMPNFLLTYRSI